MINSWAKLAGLPDDFFKAQGPVFNPVRLKTACIVREALFSNKIFDWFIDAGTLLGAFRIKKILKHDYDFDLAIIGNIDYMNEIYASLTSYYSSINDRFGYNRYLVQIE